MSDAKHSPLMNCPFCGSSRIEDLEHLDWVCCQDCGASLEDVEPSARALWNTRAATSLHHELVAALEATLCELSHCATQLAARGLAGHKDDSVSRAQAAARAALQKAKQGDKQ